MRHRSIISFGIPARKIQGHKCPLPRLEPEVLKGQLGYDIFHLNKSIAVEA